jgi:UPF0271 protein
MIKLSTIKKEQPQPKTIFIDLNSDLGEGFGIYQNSTEEKLVEFVSSVNIPCGGHAGDPIKIMNALTLAKKHNLSIGAHIGYPDIAGFGYREMNLSYDELQAMVFYQVGALKTMAAAYKMNLDYVRPHGALYKQMAQDAALAISVAKAIEQIDSWLILVAAAGESLQNVKEETKIRIAPEIIIDKQYNMKGEILFDEPILEDPTVIVSRVSKLIKEGKLMTQEESLKDMEFSTIHLSTQTNESVEIAKEIRNLFPEKPVPIAVTLVGENVYY